MKPELLTALIAGAGFVLNALWTIHNMHVRSEIRRMTDKLKDYMREEFIENSVCRAKMSDHGRRLAKLGA